jgi:hypothetical protein
MPGYRVAGANVGQVSRYFPAPGNWRCHGWRTDCPPECTDSRVPGCRPIARPALSAPDAIADSASMHAARCHGITWTRSCRGSRICRPPRGAADAPPPLVNGRPKKSRACVHEDIVRPGGDFVVIDHAASTGNDLHRIDKALVLQLAKNAGFVRARCCFRPPSPPAESPVR